MTADSHDNDDAASFVDEVFDQDFVIEDLVCEDELDGDLPPGEPEAEGDGDARLFAAVEGAVFGAFDAEEAPPAPELQEATEDVAEELGSLLEDEEDFGLDSEVDLELVTGDEGFEGASAFVLDDGEDLCADVGSEPAEIASCSPLFGEEQAARDDASAAAHDEPAAAGQGLFGSVTHELPLAAGAEDRPADGGESADDRPFDLQLRQDAEPAGSAAWREVAPEGESFVAADAPGAELPSEESFDTSGYESDDVYQDAFAEEPGPSGPPIAEDGGYQDGGDEAYEVVSAGEVDGHDIYADEGDEQDAAVIGGPGAARRRWGGALAAAAALVVVGLTAGVLGRPDLFGLGAAPVRVERVELSRPVIAVTVAEPAKVLAPAPRVAALAPSEGEGAPSVATPAATVEDAPPADRVASATPASTAVPERGRRAPAATSDVVTGAWPAAPAAEMAARGGALARFGDDLLVGGANPAAVGGDGVGAAELAGVAPGSRAFAQLHNGNYFVGRVKKVAEAAITLRVATGEVTLPRDAVAQLTRLGSAEYEELQRATQGSVRLTNNQRLVGGILTRIADDHVVLEVRSNRVMLPKASVGQILSGDDGRDVRLGTTSEEDHWLRTIAARELGTGRGLEAPSETAASPGGK